MIPLTILALITLIAILLGAWAIDIRLDAMRADLDRIESALADIADAVGVDIVPEEDWPDMDYDGDDAGGDILMRFPGTGELEP